MKQFELTQDAVNIIVDALKEKQHELRYAHEDEFTYGNNQKVVELQTLINYLEAEQ
jgi:hypothetical protein